MGPDGTPKQAKIGSSLLRMAVTSGVKAGRTASGSRASQAR